MIDFGRKKKATMPGIGRKFMWWVIVVWSDLPIQ